MNQQTEATRTTLPCGTSPSYINSNKAAQQASQVLHPRELHRGGTERAPTSWRPCLRDVIDHLPWTRHDASFRVAYTEAVHMPLTPACRIAFYDSFSFSTTDNFHPLDLQQHSVLLVILGHTSPTGNRKREGRCRAAYGPASLTSDALNSVDT